MSTVAGPADGRVIVSRWIDPGNSQQPIGNERVAVTAGEANGFLERDRGIHPRILQQPIHDRQIAVAAAPANGFRTSRCGRPKNPPGILVQPIDNRQIAVPASRFNGSGAAGDRVYSDILRWQAVDDTGKKVACLTGPGPREKWRPGFGVVHGWQRTGTIVSRKYWKRTKLAIQYADTFVNILGNYVELDLHLLDRRMCCVLVQTAWDVQQQWQTDPRYSFKEQLQSEW